MRLVTLLLTTFLSTSAYSDNHSNAPLGSGAFVALLVQAQDPDAYVEALKNNPAPFKAIGSSLAGACITKPGHDYPGQMFIYSAFESVEQAMAAIDKYDPMKATPELMATREIKYNVMSKPLKQFTLEPGYERLWRLNI